MEEIERRFLCSLDPEAFAPAETLDIEQGYLAGGELQIRIRRQGDRWVLGAKHGRGLRRTERDVSVSRTVGEGLLEQSGSWRLAKRRHRAGRWEVDVYAGKLAGLVVAECELRRVDEALPTPPVGLTLGREITDEVGLTAQGLARLSPEECRSLLDDLEM